jgi:hypothetical protein
LRTTCENAERPALGGVDQHGVGTNQGKLRCAAQQALRHLAAVRHDIERRCDVLVLEVVVALGDPERDGENDDRWRDHVHRIG